MDMLKDLLKKKAKDGSAPMDPKAKEAKMGVLKEISDMAGKSMGDDIRGLKKVEVASPDSAGLKLGLDKAKEMVDPSDDDAEDAADGGSDEDSEHENPAMLSEHGRGHDGKAAQLIADQIDEESDEGDLSPEEIDALISELQEKKMKLSQK